MTERFRLIKSSPSGLPEVGKCFLVFPWKKWRNDIPLHFLDTLFKHRIQLNVVSVEQ